MRRAVVFVCLTVVISGCTSDLREVWVKSPSAKKTTLLLVGLGALYLAVGALAAQSIEYGPWPTN
jgi:hypothetical protein